MKLCNQTSDPDKCRIFFFKDRLGKPIYMHLLLKLKVFPQIFFFFSSSFGGVHTAPPNLGSAQKLENLSTLGLYCTDNKTIINFLLDTIQEPLTRPFQNTPYFSQGDNFSIFDGCPKFGNFQNYSF